MVIVLLQDGLVIGDAADVGDVGVESHSVECLVDRGHRGTLG